ncbi:MAG: hypothetical protein K6F46_11220 [Desulfovibrio sp.]|nr:hypothetical protein [Desulfovibrio sp.]
MHALVLRNRRQRTIAALCLFLIVLFSWGGGACATPLTTQYFGLNLPPDWMVLDGPRKEGKSVRVQLGNKAKTAAVALAAGPARPGDAEKAADAYAKRLRGTKPTVQNGQLYFTFGHQGEHGYAILREDALSGLLLICIVSGDLKAADFVYEMRGPYKALRPVRPAP